MTDKLIITVAGATGTGKSTISLLLAEFLSHTGFNVELNLTDDQDPNSIIEHFEEKLELLSEVKKVGIVINEQLIMRDSVNNC